ncbi:MASE1 domain-containing protein [Nocardioides sp. Arc9.136]|uniref:MASE1 domain-containing protein n=1 Tax=Nocardioides sp. Arc9.136 TaxID=2996826 RepID=UPI00266605F0|nr:MASE1 domain-containing protein [Nocardioides sp. Arc9.136]WKN47213.1 MASE1 domain-containing protein [Nocardioides sp. Arc9.136]
MTRPAARGDRRTLGWSWTALLLVATTVAGWLAIELSPEGFPVASWWPGAGLAAALVALSPLRRAPLLTVAIALATLLANLVAGRGGDLAGAFAVVNALGALAAGLVLKGLRDHVPGLSAHDDFVRLVLAGVAGAVVAVGATAAVEATVGGSSVGTAPLVLFSHLSAVLVVTPIALARRRGHRTGSDLEALLQGGATLLVAALVLGVDRSLALSIAPLPLLVWGALRLSVRTVAWELGLFALLNTVATSQGHGPFGHAYADGDVGPLEVAALSQGYLVCAVLITLPLAIAVQQRHTPPGAGQCRRGTVPPQLHRVAARHAAAARARRPAARGRAQRPRGGRPGRRPVRPARAAPGRGARGAGAAGRRGPRPAGRAAGGLDRVVPGPRPAGRPRGGGPRAPVRRRRRTLSSPPRSST